MLFFGLFAAAAGIELILWYAACILLFPMFFIWACGSADKGSFKWCGFWILLTVACLHLMGIFDAVSFVTQNYRSIALCSVGYLICSYPYVRFIEWRVFLRETYKARNEKTYRLPEEEGPVLASDHKSMIVGWLLFWPLKLTHRVLVKWVLEFFDRIVDMFEAIYNHFQAKFQQDSQAQFEKYNVK